MGAVQEFSGLVPGWDHTDGVARDKRLNPSKSAPSTTSVGLLDVFHCVWVCQGPESHLHQV